MRLETVLTPSEVEILRQGSDDPDIVSNYFLKIPGQERGWRFDDNFTEEGAWQKNVHLAEQKDITLIGGFGTGKTVGIGMSASIWCLIMSDFKFLDVAPTAFHAFQMYQSILTNVRGTRFEELIWEKPRKPHPKIILRFRIGKVLYESSLEFMSADKDGTGILSWEGDWLHIDEAGLIDNLEEVIINSGSRLRGAIRGRSRLGRFSMASNSWDNFHLWYYFDQAVSDPEHFLSLVISSRSNKNITPDQLARMVARIPKDEQERFIEGTRPEGRGWYFAKDQIYACEDKLISEYIQEQSKKGINGFLWEWLHGAGVVNLRIPPVHNRLYMLFGDPGVGSAPQRNAPVLALFDVHAFPKIPARLVAFWWGNGFGRIGPFVEQMFELIRIYKPVYVGIDSTGPQKYMNYLINEHLFKEKFKQISNKKKDVQITADEALSDEVEEYGYDSPLGKVKGIGALDFSGSMKSTYLQALRLLIEAHLFVWPDKVTGIRSQLSNYDPEKDKKIAQDIVATMAMAAHAIRTWFHVDPQQLLAEFSTASDPKPPQIRRLSGKARNRRSQRSREDSPFSKQTS